MKNKIFIFTCCLLTFAFLVGCGLEKSGKQYIVTVDTLPYTTQRVSFEVTTVDNTVPNGYCVVLMSQDFPVNVISKNFYSNSTDFTVPQITFNRAQINYAVTLDSNNFLGTWEPTAMDLGVNIVLQRAPVSSETTVSLNSLTPYAHMAEIAGKIVVVYATPNPDGDYVFTAALMTNLMVRADIALSGLDENGNPVSTNFTTNMDYGLTLTQ